MATYFTIKQLHQAQELSTINGASLESNLRVVLLAAEEELQQQYIAERARNQVDPRTLSKKQIIELTWQCKELPDDLYELLVDQGFKTGSSVYSNATPKDDDWCVDYPPHVFSDYAVGLGDQGYWEADGFSTMYAHRNGVLLNIICFSDQGLFKAWRSTTSLMSWLSIRSKPGSFPDVGLVDAMNVKWKRVRLFRAFKDIFYTPPKHSYRPAISKEEAIKHYKCQTCHQEAINFTCRAAREHYQETGVCERCAGKEY